MTVHRNHWNHRRDSRDREDSKDSVLYSHTEGQCSQLTLKYTHRLFASGEKGPNQW